MSDVDYRAMSDPELLKACGDSGEKWAAAFQQIILAPGVPVSEGLMLGWFANVIECSSDVRRWRSEGRAPSALKAEGGEI